MRVLVVYVRHPPESSTTESLSNTTTSVLWYLTAVFPSGVSRILVDLPVTFCICVILLTFRKRRLQNRKPNLTQGYTRKRKPSTPSFKIRRLWIRRPRRNPGVSPHNGARRMRACEGQGIPRKGTRKLSAKLRVDSSSEICYPWVNRRNCRQMLTLSQGEQK